jgi:FdhE protein
MLKNVLRGRQPPPRRDVAEALATLDALAARQPELAQIAALQSALIRGAYAAPAPVGVIDLADEELRALLERGAPLLADTRLPIEEGLLRESLLRLIDAAREHGVEGLVTLASGLHARRVEATTLAHSLLHNGIDEKGHLIDTFDQLKAAPEPARNLLRVALLPFLEQISAALRPRRGELPWGRGYCPCCGAWPVLGEQRGLDQTRVLRCGLCADAWPVERVRCAFCGNRDHTSLGYLQVEEEAQKQRVATCDACGHYLKLRSTLAPLAAPALLAEEIALMHLDLIALDAGFTPPG